MFQYYAPDYELDVKPSNMDNANSREYLDKIQIQVIENLRSTTTHAPSVQMTEVPRDPIGTNDDQDAVLDDLDEDTNADQRKTKRQWDKYIERDDELSASEDEGENERHGVRRQPGTKRRRNMMDYQNHDALPDNEELASGAVRVNGHANGKAVNGSEHQSSDHDEDDDLENEIDNRSNSDLGDGFESDLEDIPNGGSNNAHRPVEDQDGDLEMADDDLDPAVNNGTITYPPLTTIERQEATPPDSPPLIAAQPAAPMQQTADDLGNDAMDEGDTIEAEEEPALAKEAGREERERQDVQGEKTAEIVERQEE